VLLSFAKFEREVTGERIRDKIAASKRKGMWMGGKPPLGYDPPTDPTTRALVINPTRPNWSATSSSLAGPAQIAGVSGAALILLGKALFRLPLHFIPCFKSADARASI
jgi:DNA invertase Pin-like site-specific DNA recombinase